MSLDIDAIENHARMAYPLATRDAASSAGPTIIALCQELRAAREDAARVRAVVREAREMIEEAFNDWDADVDDKVGKKLLALSGDLPKYDRRADAFVVLCQKDRVTTAAHAEPAT